MNLPIRTGIIGFGISAKVFHAPFLKASPHYQVTTIMERHKEESKAIFPDAQIVRTIDEMLQSDVDLVVIITPNDTHFSYTKKCLEARKNVVVEKPFTINSSDALALAELVKQQDKILAVYHNRRYVSDYLTIKNILQQNLLGEVHTYDAHYNRYRAEARPQAWREQPEPGSGILYDLGAHLIDQALCLFGLPTYISGDVRMQRPHAKTDDWFTIMLDYGYLQATLKAGMLVREPGSRYMIHGDKGSFIKSGEDPQEAKLRAGEAPSLTLGEEPENVWGLLHTEINGEIIKKNVPSQKGDYGLFYEDLYQTIVNKTPLKITPLQAYNVIKIIELANESSRKKCTIECTGLIDDYGEIFK